MRIINGSLKNKKILSCTSSKMRPTSIMLRRKLFDIFENSLQLSFADLRIIEFFAGTGSLSFEAISRGTDQVTLIEKDKNIFSYLLKNIHNFDIKDKCYLINKDINHLTNNDFKTFKYNVFILDPPYQSNLLKTAIRHIFNFNLYKDSFYLIIETHIKSDINDIFLLFNEYGFSEDNITYKRELRSANSKIQLIKFG